MDLGKYSGNSAMPKDNSCLESKTQRLPPPSDEYGLSPILAAVTRTVGRKFRRLVICKAKIPESERWLWYKDNASLVKRWVGMAPLVKASMTKISNFCGGCLAKVRRASPARILTVPPNDWQRLRKVKYFWLMATTSGFIS